MMLRGPRHKSIGLLSILTLYRTTSRHRGGFFVDQPPRSRLQFLLSQGRHASRVCPMPSPNTYSTRHTHTLCSVNQSAGSSKLVSLEIKRMLLYIYIATSYPECRLHKILSIHSQFARIVKKNNSRVTNVRKI